MPSITSDYLAPEYLSFTWNPSKSWYDSFPTLTNQWEWTYDTGDHWWGSAAYSIGNCVAHALATLKEIQEYRNTGCKNMYSYEWIYGNRSGMAWQETGIYTKDALDKLKTDGVPLYQYLGGQHEVPTSQNDVQAMYSDLLTVAQQAKIFDYVQFPKDTTPQTLADFVYTYGSILVELYSDDNLLYPASNGVISDTIPPPSSSAHLMNIIGWKIINGNPYWIVHNSWGCWGDTTRAGSYGNGCGWAYMPVSYSKIIGFYVVYDYVNTKPAQWNWSYNIASGSPMQSTVKIDDTNYIGYVMNATEWNSFTSRINEFRLYRKLKTVVFTQVASGDSVSAYLINQAIFSINEMGFSLAQKYSNDSLNAQTFINFKNALNSI